MYTKDAEVKEINGIFRYSYRTVDYTSLENVIRSGMRVKIYVDSSILSMIQRKGLLKKIEILRDGTHYKLISINPRYEYKVDLENLPTFAFRNKAEAFELVDNMPEGLKPDKWIDAVFAATKDGEKLNTLYNVYKEYAKEKIEVPSEDVLIDGLAFVKSQLNALPEGVEFRQSLTGVDTEIVVPFNGNSVRVRTEKGGTYNILKNLEQEVFVKL